MAPPRAFEVPDYMGEYCWPFWGWYFRPELEETIKTMHDQYNTVTVALESPQAFRIDVADAANRAHNLQEFRENLSETMKKRRQETEDGLRGLRIPGGAALFDACDIFGTGDEAYHHLFYITQFRSLDFAILFVTRFLEWLDSKNKQRLKWEKIYGWKWEEKGRGTAPGAAKTDVAETDTKEESSDPKAHVPGKACSQPSTPTSEQQTDANTPEAKHTASSENIDNASATCPNGVQVPSTSTDDRLHQTTDADAPRLPRSPRSQRSPRSPRSSSATETVVGLEGVEDATGRSDEIDRDPRTTQNTEMKKETRGADATEEANENRESPRDHVGCKQKPIAHAVGGGSSESNPTARPEGEVKNPERGWPEEKEGSDVPYTTTREACPGLANGTTPSRKRPASFDTNDIDGENEKDDDKVDGSRPQAKRARGHTSTTTPHAGSSRPSNPLSPDRLGGESCTAGIS